MDLQVPPTRLRQIDTLNFEEMCLDEQGAAEGERSEAEGGPSEELKLTLEDCRITALRNNLDLNVERRSPAITEQSVTEERARFEPVFFSNFSSARIEQPIATTLESSETNSVNGDLGVYVPLRTGGNLTFDLAANRFETNNIFATLNPSYASGFSVSISQPLLRSGGIRASTHGIRIARYQTQISEARTKLEVIRVIAAVDRFYWRLYAARRELEVRKNEYDLAAAQLERARRRLEAGAGPEVEVIRAEAGVAERLEAVIIADNEVRDRERELKRMLNKPGLEIEGPTVLVPQTEPQPVYYRLDVHRLVEAALESRMEMLELELQVAQDRSQEAFERNQALPLLGFDYTYNISGLGATEGDAFDMMDDAEFNGHRFGLQLQVPLGNQGARSRLRRAFFTRLQRLATQAQRRAQIRQEVANAADQLDTNWQRILASRQRTILAARTLKAEERQFELGLRTSTEVLEAQTDLADAQSAEVRALAEYQIAQVDLAFATGNILGVAGVTWEPIVPAGP